MSAIQYKKKMSVFLKNYKITDLKALLRLDDLEEEGAMPVLKARIYDAAKTVLLHLTGEPDSSNESSVDQRTGHSSPSTQAQGRKFSHWGEQGEKVRRWRQLLWGEALRKEGFATGLGCGTEIDFVDEQGGGGLSERNEEEE
eukprot:2029628-Rhodomonas_salina.1